MYGISNLASETADYLSKRDREARREEYVDRRSDEIRGEYEWQDLEAAMADAPEAQRKMFWTGLLEWLEVEHKYLHNRRVDHIAAPMQEGVALAIDDQIRREMDQEKAA